MNRDARGLEMTAAGPDSVAAFDRTIEAYLSLGPDVGDLARAAVAADPESPMANCLMGNLIMLTGISRTMEKARPFLGKAEALSARGTKRERMHAAALRAWVEGDLAHANAIWDEITAEHPHDVLAFRLGHFLHFYVGALREMREAAGHVLPLWDESVPGYGYVLGCWGFAMEETGAYLPAEKAARRAVEINPSDIWSGHAVAHVYEMTGRQHDGIAWIDGHAATWRANGVFRNHIWWHRTLYYLERERWDDALAAFDREIWAEPSEDNLDIDNAAAVLMRLLLAGRDVGPRWDGVADMAAGRVGDNVRPFNTLHFVMAAAGAGRLDLARELVASMRAFAEDPANADMTVTPITRDIAVPVGDAIVAFFEGDHERVVSLMQPVRHRMVPLGGSWAQRDVWERMFLESALRAGRHALARSVLAARTLEKPASAPSWRLYARSLSGMGDTPAAERAAAEAEALIRAG